MAVDMTPKVGDYSINIPITFDYRGGRSGNVKGKIIISIADVILTIIMMVGVSLNEDFELWQKVIFLPCILYMGGLVMRYLVFRENYYSNIYEQLKADDFELKLDYIWQIFDIDSVYPYICYYKNGYKGIFVRMEKDAITGKDGTNVFNHYESVGNAYNICHSLNMNMVHIDYMDNVGNDARMQQLYDDLTFVENPDMQTMLIDIYENLKSEMSRNYACFDIYLFLTRDNLKNFLYNVHTVANAMLSGNFITYKVLDKYEIAKVCVSLFNFHEFSVLEACESTMSAEGHTGIVPISISHADGTVEVLNKTVEEKAAEKEFAERRRADAEAEKRNRRRRKRKSGSGGTLDELSQLPQEDLDLFDDIN